MTELNPCGFLQNAGTTHTAEQMRDWHGLISAGSVSSLSLIPRGGINPVLGNALSVTQTGSPSMAVVIKSGFALIPGTEGSKQGVYSVGNDADVTLSITAAHPTLPRIDIVCFKVQDTAYSGGVNSSSLVVVTGTAAASPAAPAAPANSLTMAQVAVAAAATTIVNANITDTRYYLAGPGGVIQCTSTTRPGTGTIPFGTPIYETDTGKRWHWHKDSSWFPDAPITVVKTADETVTSSTTLQNDDHLFVSVDINATYTYRIFLLHTVAGSIIDIKFAFTYPTSATLTGGFIGPELSIGAGATSGTAEFAGWAEDATSPSPSISHGSSGAALQDTSIGMGILITGGTSGTLQLQWAQVTSSAAGQTLKKNSYIEVTRIL